MPSLVASVVMQALRDLGAKREREGARRWLMSDSPRPFGFVWCVESLGLNAEWARAKILDRRFSVAGLLPDGD